MLNLFAGSSLRALLVSGLLGGLVTGAVAAWPLWSTANNAGYGKAIKERREVEDRFFARESVLLYEVGAARQANYELADRMEEILDASDEARAKNRQALAAEKAKTKQAIDWVADALRELDRVQSDWKGKPVPPDVIRPFCLRFGQSDCDEAPPATYSDRVVEVRGSGGRAEEVDAEALPGPVERDPE